jgi:hypothetical protein
LLSKRFHLLSKRFLVILQPAKQQQVIRASARFSFLLLPFFFLLLSLHSGFGLGLSSGKRETHGACFVGDGCAMARHIWRVWAPPSLVIPHDLKYYEKMKRKKRERKEEREKEKKKERKERQVLLLPHEEEIKKRKEAIRHCHALASELATSASCSVTARMVSASMW